MADKHEHHDSTMEMGETLGTDALTGINMADDSQHDQDDSELMLDVDNLFNYRVFQEHQQNPQNEQIIMAQFAAHMRQFMVDDGFREAKEQVVQKFMYQYMKAKKLDFTAAQFLEDAELGDNPEIPESGFNMTAGKNLFDELEHRVPNQQPQIAQNDGVVIVEAQNDGVVIVEDGADVVPQLLPVAEPAAVQNRVLIFSKLLKPSDVGLTPGMSASLQVPKHAAHSYLDKFPSILKNGEIIGHTIRATDINGQTWEFKMMRHKYRDSYHLRNQWHRFVKQNGLGVFFCIRFETINGNLHIFWELPPQNVE